MTPGARLAAAIEVLDAVDGSERPADSTLAAYFRNRRYAGSQDRRAVADLVWRVLRRRARLDWWIGGGATARRRVIAEAVLGDGLSAASLAPLFDGQGHAPPPLSSDEAALARRLTGRTLDDPAQPAAVAAEAPDWLYPLVSDAEWRAMAVPGPLDLRVNTLKGERDSARRALAAEGVATEPTPRSPLGLRVAGRVRLDRTRAWRAGLVEVQDEGSQLAAAAVEAAPGLTVIDWCAGAGGKTLALAAAMEGTGRLIACDVDGQRLKRLEDRACRAGAVGIETVVMATGRPPPVLPPADRVLVDAPCSGLGTWRRAPEAKWRLTPERLDGLVAAQRAILDVAAAAVAPGGWLVYVTCSLLARENEDQVAAFTARHPDYRARPPRFGPALTPAGAGTDGFFIAVFERRSGSGPSPMEGRTASPLEPRSRPNGP